MDKPMNKIPTTVPPRDADFCFMKKILLILILSGLVGVVAIGVSGYFSGSKTGPVAAVVMFLVLLGLLWLTWKDHLLISRIVLPLLAFAVSFFVTAAGYGIHDRAMFDFSMTLLLAGLLLGRVGIVAIGFLAILAIGGIAYAEITGRLVNPLSAYTTFADAVIINVSFALSCIVYYLAINNLTNSLQRMHRSEAALSENNRELETIRLGLEEQVGERTRNLETVRQEVETANQALQAQMWQISGLAQLGDVMRGEQDLPTLSANALLISPRLPDNAFNDF